MLTKYIVKIQTSNGTLVESPLCNGTEIAIIQNLKCLIPMASFLNAPFTLG